VCGYTGIGKQFLLYTEKFKTKEVKFLRSLLKEADVGTSFQQSFIPTCNNSEDAVALSD
jgi:hypothetical protein